MRYNSDPGILPTGGSTALAETTTTQKDLKIQPKKSCWSNVGRLSSVLFRVSCVLARFTRISAAFHRNFTRNHRSFTRSSPEFHDNFARASNWEHPKKGDNHNSAFPHGRRMLFWLKGSPIRVV